MAQCIRARGTAGRSPAFMVRGHGEAFRWIGRGNSRFAAACGGVRKGDYCPFSSRQACKKERISEPINTTSKIISIVLKVFFFCIYFLISWVYMLDSSELPLIVPHRTHSSLPSP